MIRQVQAEDWERLRDARLRALADAPCAFSSTLSREQAFEDRVWQERATPRGSGASFAAEQDGRFGAIASCFVAEDPTAVHLVGMWVAPEPRRGGVGLRLVDTTVNWARPRGAKRCGFGRTDPTPTLPYEPGAGADVLVLQL